MATPDNWTPVEIKDFSGGMRKDKSTIELADNEVRLAYNALLDERGAIRKRSGYSKLSSNAISADTVGVDNIIRFYNSTGSYTVVAVETTTYNKLFVYDETATTYTEITGGTALSAGTHIEFCVYKDWLLICNGSQFQYWSGTGSKADCGYKAGSVSVVPKIMAISDDRLFAVTNTAAQRFTIFFTEVGVYDTNPSDINFASTFDMDILGKTSDSNGINALWQFGEEDSLLALCDNNINILDGVDDTDYILRQLSRTSGAVSPTAVVETEDGLVLFIGNGNIYAFDGTRLLPIGEAIKPGLVGFNLEDAVAEYIPQWRSVLFSHRNGTFVWHVPSGLKSAFSTKAYWDIGGWTELGIGISAICRYDKRNDANKIVFGKSDSAYLYTFDDGSTDDGSNFDFKVQLKTYTLGPFMQTKECRQAWVMCETGQTSPCSAEVSCIDAYNGPDVSSVTARVNLSGAKWNQVYWNQFVWVGGTTVIAIADIKSGMTGNAFSVTVSTSDAYAITIYGIGLSLKVKERI